MGAHAKQRSTSATQQPRRHCCTPGWCLLCSVCSVISLFAYLCAQACLFVCQHPAQLKMSLFLPHLRTQWLVICHVRGRPLPCQPLSSEKQAWGCYTPLLEELHHRTFGITADLRHNCSDSINLSGGSDKQGQQQQHSEPDAQQQEGQAHSSGAVKPVVYLGNASCALQVRSDCVLV